MSENASGVVRKGARTRVISCVFGVAVLSALLAGCDLSITKDARPEPATVGEPLTYILKVENNEPPDGLPPEGFPGSDGTQPSVVVEDTLPATVRFVSAEPSQGDCEDPDPNKVVVCELGDLALDEEAKIKIVVIPREAGSITNTATVQPGESEPTEPTTLQQGDPSISQEGTDGVEPLGGGEPEPEDFDPQENNTDTETTRVKPKPKPDPDPDPNPDNCTIKGNNKSNTLTGTPGRDVICGLGGNDTIQAKDGNDVVRAGAGKDTVQGGDGNDTLEGGGGDDNIQGNDGNDALDGGKGVDNLQGDAGRDSYDGGPGRDICSVEGGEQEQGCP